MKQNIIHIGLDVDDTQYHGSAFNKDTGEVIDFKSRPTLQGLLQQLDRMARHFRGCKTKLCYEASYIGYCPHLLEVLARSPRYQPAVQSLTCYKGIKNIFALTIITEIGDIKRFSHPRKLVSWIGMDIREYSSGGKHNRFGITKHGNRYLRTAIIEANQRGYRTARIGKDVKARRKDIAPELINIADRCLRRLNKKGNHLLLAGKHPNKVKVARAREMVGFVCSPKNIVFIEQGQHIGGT